MSQPGPSWSATLRGSSARSMTSRTIDRYSAHDLAGHCRGPRR